MIAYVVKSLAQAILVMLAVALVAFSMFRFIGDPVSNLMGQEATIQDREQLARELGLEDPIPIQFARFVGNAARLEFGVSYRQGRPVSDLIAERLPATVELALLSAIFALVVGIALGVYTAIYRNGILSHAILSVSLIGVSLPTFLIGIGLIWLFAVELRWLPSFGRGDVVKIRRRPHQHRVGVLVINKDRRKRQRTGDPPPVDIHQVEQWMQTVAMDPADVAADVAYAVKAGRFWVLTHQSTLDRVKRRNADLEAGRIPRGVR